MTTTDMRALKINSIIILIFNLFIILMLWYNSYLPYKDTKDISAVNLFYSFIVLFFPITILINLILLVINKFLKRKSIIVLMGIVSVLQIIGIVFFLTNCCDW
jgi:hypothetical protein